MAPVYPPSTSANAQPGLQMHEQGNQVWDAGQAQQWANHAQGMPAPAQGGLRGPSKSRQRRKEKRAEFGARPKIIAIRKKKAQLDSLSPSVIDAAAGKKLHFQGKEPVVATKGRDHPHLLCLIKRLRRIRLMMICQR
jgi:hypothetical protein